jgi:hypothetical protein
MHHPRFFQDETVKIPVIPAQAGIQKRRDKIYSGRNSLIKKEDYDIPASGMDSILDFFPTVGKRVS